VSSPERDVGAELRAAAAFRLPEGFAGRVLAGAAARRRQLRAERRLVLATALACFLGLNGAHWISAARAQRANLAQWQLYLTQAETLQTSY
jgi:hypothetical protein